MESPESQQVAPAHTLSGKMLDESEELWMIRDGMCGEKVGIKTAQRRENSTR